MDADKQDSASTKKKKTGLIVGIIIAAAVVIAGVFLTIFCLNTPKNLEELYQKDADFARQIDAFKSETSTDGVTTDITFDGNSMKLSFKLTKSDTKTIESTIKQFETNKNAFESTLKPAIQRAEQSGLSDVSITVEVTANNKTVWSHTVK